LKDLKGHLQGIQVGMSREEGFGRDPLEAITSRVVCDRGEQDGGEKARGDVIRAQKAAKRGLSFRSSWNLRARRRTSDHARATTNLGKTASGGRGVRKCADCRQREAGLKDAISEFTRRKCAKGGEVLIKRQIRDIEAQTMEFYGRQRVEVKKIMEKVTITPNKGSK
jgi:hypothetical protein